MNFAERVLAVLKYRRSLATRLSPAEFRALWSYIKEPLRAWVMAGRPPNPTMAFDAKPRRADVDLSAEMHAAFARGKWSPEVNAEIAAFTRKILGIDPDAPPPEVIAWVRQEVAAGNSPKPDSEDDRKRCSDAVGYVVPREVFRRACAIVIPRKPGRPKTR